MTAFEPSTEFFLGMSGARFGIWVLSVSILLFVLQLCRRFLPVFRALPDPRFSAPIERIKGVIRDGFFQRKLPRYRWAGVVHIVIFWGFLVLGVRSLELVAKGVGATFIPFPAGFSAIYAGVRDIAEILVLFACVGAVVHRGWAKPTRYEGSHRAEAYLVLLLIAFLMVSDIILEGSGIALAAPGQGGVIADRVAALLLSPLPSAALASLRLWSYWLHILTLFLFLNLLPVSKHFHVLAALPNLFFRKLEKGAAKPPRWETVDVRELETIGIGKYPDLTWKQMLDLYSCTECGRCTDNCPAHAASRSLSPKAVSMKLRDGGRRELIPGPVLSDQEIWGCTTCGSCDEQCPVGIEHVDRMVDLRRYLVGMAGRFPAELEPAFRNAEVYGDPRGMGAPRRREWVGSLKLEAVDDDAEVIYWAGCAGAFDDRYREVALAFAEILKEAGVRFQVLGEESCCGDFARRTGNEYLFQVLARKNLETLEKYRGKRIVTTCPHCYNTLKNEYRQLGGDLAVSHHSEFLFELLREGRVKLSREAGEKICYHDPCYLGRHNGIYDPPRGVLHLLRGQAPAELPRSRENGFCCGAGGGFVWLEEPGQRVSDLRVNEVVASGADVVVTACPYCLMMLEEGLSSREGAARPKVLDLAEMVARAR